MLNTASTLEVINLMRWLSTHRKAGGQAFTNKIIWEDADLMTIVAVGPHYHSDYHINPFEEVFYQLAGETMLSLVIDGRPVTKELREGDVFLLPPKIPHSPQRPEGSITLVVERTRPRAFLDAFEWYCSSCWHCLDRRELHRSEFDTRLGEVFQAFRSSASVCPRCGGA